MLDIANKENDDLFKILLNNYFFKNFKDDSSKKNQTAVELIVFPECNQTCEYCYINRHRDKLYPKEIRNRETIFSNLKILLEYFQENDFIIDALDIFSGSFLDIDDGYKMLDIIWEYSLRKMVFKQILMPTNGSFLYSNDGLDRIEKYLKKFKDIGMNIHLSYSVDGKVIEDKSRPINNNIDRDSDFYDRIAYMIKEYDHGMHPMVSAYAIEDWIKNYDWFAEFHKKHNLNISNLMMLEVRNDDWTLDKIGNYLEFLNHVIDYRFKLNDEDIDKFARTVFGFDGKNQYDNIAIHIQKDGMTCALQNELYIRLGDLSIVPCHRLSYDKFTFGKFIVNDDKIVDIQSDHIEFATSVLSLNPAYSHPKCENCNINKLCARGCLGSQYEVNKDPLQTIDSVCDLYMAKFMFLIKKYDDMGLLDHIFMHYAGDIDKRSALNESWKLRQIQRGELR